MAMRVVPCFGVSLAMAMYGWYGFGTRIGSMLVYALEWTAKMAPPRRTFGGSVV
jgi:hypothetical protein